ncbi:MAG TPA: helix-turn-helix transcriptional regulator [Gemmatimonadales bacterium]|nr:helix-turn-helix transcriptional regulator [Gemmatimonadales bacterium]
MKIPRFRPVAARVAAVLSPNERGRVDAAGSGHFALSHHDSVREAIRVVRDRPVDAVLVSLSRCAGEAPALLEKFTRAYPAVPAIALMTARADGDAETLLNLGATGIRQVVDATVPAGWRRLREVLGASPRDRSQAILRPVYQAIGPLNNGSRRFWEELVRTAPDTPTVAVLAARFGMPTSTLVSRFVRNGLPSPKDHLVAVRLCYAARMFDEGDHTISDVSFRLGFASPQSFGRHLRAVMGITPGEFRSRFPFSLVMERFLDRLVRPHVKVWRTFRPLEAGR